MAKRELSSTLRNLKFMQRAALREEKTKKEHGVKPEENFPAPSNVRKRCVVIMEGDPHPGALKGRLSFQSFNPSIDKLNEEEANLHQPSAPTSNSGDQSEQVSFRETWHSSEGDGAECSNSDRMDYQVMGNHKRKQSDTSSGAKCPNKSPKNGQKDEQSSQRNNVRPFLKSKGEKLDFSILRPSKNKK